MDIFAKYATDTDAELNGVQKSLDETTMVLVARQGNDNASSAWTDWSEMHAEKLTSPDKKVRADAERARVLDVMSQCILLGWSGVTYQGQPLEYTQDNARKLLELSEFRSVIMQLSADVDNFRVKRAEAVVKN